MAKWQNGEITKWWNSEMTFLNSENKWLPVFLLCPVAISLHSKNRQNSAQHVKTHNSCCAITFVTFCQWLTPVTWSLSFQGYLLFPGASWFSKWCQFLPPHPLPKNPFIQVTPCLDIFRTTHSLLSHCLGQRTKCTPSCFKAIYWQLQ